VRFSILLIASLLGLSACGDLYLNMESFVTVEWDDGLPEGSERTLFYSTSSAENYPDMNFDGFCESASHAVAREEPPVFWVRCELGAGMEEIHLYDAKLGTVVETIWMLSYQPREIPNE